MLTADQRNRYARHLLLVEIGEQGQSRLCAAELCMTDGVDADAAAVAADYLTRAGVTIADAPTATAVGVATTDQVEQLACRPELRAAAASLAGAFAAVEAIKTITGAGQPATLPSALRLVLASPGESA